MKQDMSSLCEDLPYWEFMEDPKSHIVLMDGSIVSGIDVALMDIECMEDNQINRFTDGLRNALNSVSENIHLQFHFRIRSDFSDVVCNIQEPADAFMKKLSSQRLERLQAAQVRGELMRPMLTIYVRTPMIKPSRMSLLSTPKLFSEDALKHYEDTLEVLLENIQGLQTSFRQLGLESNLVSKQDLIDNIYTFFNPKRSKEQPCPTLIQSNEKDLEADVLEDEAWLANPSPRSQMVFGDLVLDHHQITLDSTFHRLITLKTMPEVTVSGQMASFLKLKFPYDGSCQKSCV